MPRIPLIDDDTLLAWNRDGFVSLGKVLDADEVVDICACLDELGARHPPTHHGVILNNVWKQHRDLAALVTAEAMWRSAASLLGERRVRLFQDNLVWKHPGSASIEWHQDYSYQPLDNPHGLTLWLCLDHANAGSGCLHYIPGTHRLGERVATDFFAGTGQPIRKDLPPLDWRSRLGEVKPMETQPGELLAHHPFVWHMSPVNDSSRHRRAISVNWVTEQVRWKPSQAPHPFNYELGLTDGDPIDDQDFPVFAVS